ncbi:hypothetical protein GOP47_0015407 [Adiantum capillus-veneris]|uniref:DUF4378 domain-containing protein n=1 Tax=Adiantum capillus-veneris TaxID=13818 RepID=A0A9D4UKJ9_ADICA|nr:hypothetical protein GOP47_0015407 [Adiantum capillus-veneris]
MPFDTTPGQVLSSIPSSSDKRRSSKLGGCASVLFQIFHGKRLFPRKSLPAERPKQVASNYTDEKLPIAKLLLIADENRSGPLKDADEDEDIDMENVAMAEPYEEKAPRRTPGVVARLMGLETMPSPESACGERKQSELRNIYTDNELYTDGPLPERRISSAAAVHQFSSTLQGFKSREFKTDLPARFAARQRKTVQDGTAKSKVLTKVPSLPPHHLDASFPSSAKGDSLNKNSRRIQKIEHLLEAAPQMLKANVQPNRQIGSQRLQTKTGSLNPKSQPMNSEAQAPGSIRDEAKTAQAAPRYSSNDMISRRQMADTQRSQLTQQHIGSSFKGSSNDATLIKRKHGYQRVLEEPKAVLAEKLRSNVQRQDEARRRLSQPTVCSSIKARPSRHPSPPKSFQDSSGGACSSQASNCTPSSSAGAISSQLVKSHVGSNNVSAGKHSSSSARGSLTKLDDVNEVVDTMQPVKSMYNKVADLPYGNTTILRNSDASHTTEPENSLYSQFTQDGSTSSAIYSESLQRSSLESSTSSDPSLSEFTTTSEECSNFLGGENVAMQKQMHGIKMASDFCLTESSFESLSESLDVSYAEDTASSHTQSDDTGKSVDSAHTYSGRNTAAILQELLTALSSSTQKKSSCAKKKEGTVPSSLDSELEKPQIFSAGNAHCKEDFCMESTFQDSASSTSSDNSQLSQGNEEYTSITSKDRVSITEVQVEDKRPHGSSGTGRTQLQHGLSRDCEALMSTISKLHRIDPEVIGLKVRTAKDPGEQAVLTFASPLSWCLSDFDRPAEETQQLDHSLSSSSNLPADDDIDSIYMSDIGSSFITGHNEVAVWNKKLVTDCINEAFKNLSQQMYKFSSSLSEPPSATHVLSRVYKQLDEWRGMSTHMNLDDIIEKEMKLTTRSWRNIGTETEEVAEVVESTIFSGLLEEVLLELI